MGEEIVPFEDEPAPSPIALYESLRASGAATDVSLVLPPDIPYKDYEALAVYFGFIHRSSQWVIGDLLNYGERSYGETYAQAEKHFGLARQTLANYAYVSSKIPRSRRRPRVNFSLHQVVASKSPTEQKELLKLADDNQWTRQQLYDYIDPPERFQSVEAEIELLPESGNRRIDVLPPEVDDLPPHICACFKCGRLHRDDEDVEALA